METFVWDQNFVTELSEVDEQHQGLVDLFNELSRSLFDVRADTRAEREPLLHGIFERLVAYTKYHFSDEEALMHSAGVDVRHIEAHAALHQQFVQQVGALWATRSTLEAPAQSFVHFLTAWLGLHILGIDQSMARQIAAIAQGVPSDQAYAREMSAPDNSTLVLLKMINKLYQVLSAQNAALVQANQGLEGRVAQRTRELAQANSDLQQVNERLQALGRTDGLLQIANRGYFDDLLARASASAFRRQQPLGLLMIDVDEFKRYNDHFGHQAGDACLLAVAQAVQGAMQRSTDLVARYGGEELVVLLPDADASGVNTVAARVVASVAALALPHPASSTGGCVTVSVGVAARVPRPQEDATALVAEADAALYRAKAAGRNQWCMAIAR